MLNASTVTRNIVIHADFSPKTVGPTSKSVHAEVVLPISPDSPTPIIPVVPVSPASPVSPVTSPVKKIRPKAIQHKAHLFDTHTNVTPSPSSSTPEVGTLSPSQVSTAYSVNQVTNQGQGVTVAIVDVYNDPNITNDLSVFSTQYGLPQMDGKNGDPSFSVVEQSRTSDSPVGGTSDTALETSLDVEWVHAIAPYANIILEEVSSFAYVDGSHGLLPGVQTAAVTKGVVAVSVSYGGAEFTGETSYENYLMSSTAAIDFSTGDDSYPEYPATSPNVLAVGGTGLYIASARGRYGYETAWGGIAGEGAGGGGTSSQYSTPSFQSSNGVNDGGRAIPDISAVGDVNTVVSVYDSYDTSVYGSPWLGVAGTSVATPIVSAMVALGQQARITAGLAPLNSPEINARLYAAYNSPAYSTDFHDITVGNNSEVNSSGTTTYTGFSATTGYDEATGIGSPIANQFVALIAAS